MQFSKIILAACAAFTLCTSVLAADKAPEVSPYGSFYRGNGVEIEMAQFAKKNKDGLNDVLLKITGQNAFKAGIDGKVLKYTAVHGGTGINYQIDDKNRMSLRNPYGESWSMIEVYLDGKTIAVAEDAAASKQVQPLHLLTASQAAK